MCHADQCTCPVDDISLFGGGDYGVFAEGRYHLTKSVQELYDWLQLRLKEKE